MGKMKRYAFFTAEQQILYEGLTERQRKYIDYRVQGNNKNDSYRMTGYTGNKAGQAAHMMEKRNPVIGELIDVVIKNKEVQNFQSGGDEGNLNKLLDAKANQNDVDKVVEKIEGADSETAKSIKFYRDIVRGAIKTTKTTKKYDKDGNLVGWTKVTENDVKLRMEAREKLDRLLGTTSLAEIDKFTVGSITVQIVDASMKSKELDTTPENIDNLEYTEGDDIDSEPVIEGEDDE